MRAYVTAPRHLSQGIQRVVHALENYAPADVVLVTDRDEADLVIGHVIGTTGIPEWIASLHPSQRYGIVQYCLWTTEHPTIDWWAPVWKRAAVVASYYDLDFYLEQAHEDPNEYPLVRVPLGVNTTIFAPVGNEKIYDVGTSGHVAGTETVDLWAQAIQAIGGRQFHLGPDLQLGPGVDYLNGCSDVTLAAGWSACRYVSGLRRSEGFELPAYEGLASGARPVMFAREDAIHWLGTHAEYIVEAEPILPQLLALLQREYRPVTVDEIAWVRQTFRWKTTAERIWARVIR